MTQTQLLALARLEVVEASSTDAISDVNLLLILNLACTEFINRTDALPTSSLFNCVLDLFEYSLATYVPTFGKIRKEGVWLYNASTAKWTPLSPTTTGVLNRDFPLWLNATSSVPRWYSVDGNTLTVYPKSSATYVGTNYLKIFHYARSTDMADSAAYPFSGSTTVRYPHLADYEPELIEFVRYKLKRMVGKNADADASLGKFYLKCEEIKKKMMYRPDLISSIQANGAGNLAYSKGVFTR